MISFVCIAFGFCVEDKCSAFLPNRLHDGRGNRDRGMNLRKSYTAREGSAKFPVWRGGVCGGRFGRESVIGVRFPIICLHGRGVCLSIFVPDKNEPYEQECVDHFGESSSRRKFRHAVRPIHARCCGSGQRGREDFSGRQEDRVLHRLRYVQPARETLSPAGRCGRNYR